MSDTKIGTRPYIIGPTSSFFVVPTAGGDSVAFTNWIARAGLGAPYYGAYKALLDGLTTDGFFDGSGNSALLDALYIFATADATTAKLNLVKNSFNLTVTGSAPTFTLDTGFLGSAGANGLLSGFIPSSASGNLTQNSAHIMVWNNTNATLVAPAIGVNDNTAGNAELHIYPKFTDNNQYCRTNDDVAAETAGAPIGDARGMATGVRTAAGTSKDYFNGADQSVAAGTSDTLPTKEIVVLGFNDNGTTTGNDVHQLMAAGWGAGLTNTQQSNLYTRVHTYLQTIAGIAY